MTINTYAQVNIGRNVKGVPMGDDEWTTFQSAAMAILVGCSLDSGHTWQDNAKALEEVMVHRGRGQWRNEAGEIEREESVYISLVSVFGFNEELLVKLADSIGAAYGQEYVAVLFS